MKTRFFAALALAAISIPAMAAEEFPGAIIADFYMSEFSIPKGWELSYKGLDNGVQVFVMDRDLDTYPQTAFLQPIEQMRRLMCGDDELKQMVNGGTLVRVDSRDKRGGKTSLTKGPTLTRC
ncbi:hypothetical protein ACWKWJ_01345 [Sphingopyxis terrae subsp. ummariensis]|uniref:hypothetical protein n=1 Tax=Sphingopyxis terrae TaxID=33052 RepID=UPI000A6F1B80|nr:hypothetical protein [Sphingopyxis terrae]